MNDFNNADTRAEHGPFDFEETLVSGDVIDFGALLVPNNNPDVTVRMEVEEGTARGVAVTLDLGTSAVQLSVFAAPKTEGVWADVAAQLEQTLVDQGATVVREEHALGLSLRVTTAVETAGARELRFIGVDGPRWFLRGIITGEAVDDRAEASRIIELIRSIVVRRGDEALPPRELLAMTLPNGSVAPPRSFD